MKTERLNTEKHDRSCFNCEEEELTTYLKTRAKKEQRNKLSVCYVTTNEDGGILGYYTLSTSGISKEDIPEKYQKQTPRGYVVPVILLGRLARDVTAKGTGGLLLFDALKKCYEISFTMGAMAVVVDPKNEFAVNFYQKFGFITLSNGKMFLPIKVIADIPNINS
jgi:predicted GNAT family N-acyltransferase